MSFSICLTNIEGRKVGEFWAIVEIDTSMRLSVILFAKNNMGQVKYYRKSVLPILILIRWFTEF